LTVKKTGANLGGLLAFREGVGAFFGAGWRSSAGSIAGNSGLLAVTAQVTTVTRFKDRIRDGVLIPRYRGAATPGVGKKVAAVKTAPLIPTARRYLDRFTVTPARTGINRKTG
jgi:hypothetical protein